MALKTAKQEHRRQAKRHRDNRRHQVVFVLVLVQRKARAGCAAVDEAGVGPEVGKSGFGGGAQAMTCAAAFAKASASPKAKPRNSTAPGAMRSGAACGAGVSSKRLRFTEHSGGAFSDHGEPGRQPARFSLRQHHDALLTPLVLRGIECGIGVLDRLGSKKPAPHR